MGLVNEVDYPRDLESVGQDVGYKSYLSKLLFERQRRIGSRNKANELVELRRHGEATAKGPG